MKNPDRMKSFLEHVAEDILSKWGNDLSRTVVVFPNKRASLFLNEHLARLAGHPIWSPRYITISELFRQSSAFTVADPILSVCLLHKSYTEITGIDETLDHFYGWGQLLLADFDDIDKNMAPVERVFCNIHDVHEMDSIDYLTDKQKEILSSFFSGFSDNQESILRERFMRLWSRLLDIYTDYNKRMANYCQNDGTPIPLAYEGHLYRSVIEQGTQNLDADRYIFVGFNVVQKVEQALFSKLKAEGRAVFYWDYDHYYKDNPHNEAGTYIRQLISNFGNTLDDCRDEIFAQMNSKKDITYLSAPTDNIQARYIAQWLLEDDCKRIKAGARTAIVMADEKLLPTILHSLPKQVSEVNITTGYPLQQTPIATFVEAMINLQLLGFNSQGKPRRRYEQNVMSHPYIRYVSNEMKAHLIQQQEGENVHLRLCDITRWMMSIIQDVAHSAADALMQESLYRMYTLLNRILQLLDDDILLIDTVTYQRLIDTLTRQTSIPFHGEPVIGIQIMGVLETRNLDFDHVLLLSCSEGNLPKGLDDSSFIPHAIRKAFGLTTIENKVAVYAYYFYSLIQRASDVTLAYNNSTQQSSTGEMSRFMLQFLVESNHSIKRMHLSSRQKQTKSELITILKTQHMLDILRNRYDTASGMGNMLSPSALSLYLHCKAQFYYRYVEGIKEPKEIVDEVDNKIFGDIFHRASELIYKSLTHSGNKTVSRDQLQYILTKARRKIDDAVDTAFFDILHPEEKPRVRLNYNGLQLIYRNTIIEYLRKLLRIDMHLAPFTIVGLEQKFTMPFSVQTSQGLLNLNVGGTVDRIDIISKNGLDTMRVVDYKTGKRDIDTPLQSIETIFDTNTIQKHAGYYLQTLLYSIIIKRYYPQYTISPALLFIQTAKTNGYDPTLCIAKEQIQDIAKYQDVFMLGLQKLIAEIFDPSVPFTPITDTHRCSSCSYRILCGRG